MKPVSNLYNIHPSSDIYIVGSGSSMRAFPSDFLKDKITIGCNMAWKNAPIKYGITIHPDLNIPEFMDGESPRPEIIWITKKNKSKSLLTLPQFEYANSHFYNFETKGKPATNKEYDPNDQGRMLEWIAQPTGDFLYQWSSISQTAMNLAANMGAKNIFLVGCDNCSLSGNHHGHQQHTRWQAVTPDYRYNQYYEGTAEVRDALIKRGINVLSLTPFAGLNTYEADFARLCNLYGKPKFLSGDKIKPNFKSKFMTIGYKIKSIMSS